MINQNKIDKGQNKMEKEQREKPKQKIELSKFYVIITKVVIIFSILWEMFLFDKYYDYSGSKNFNFGYFVEANTTVVIVIGLMWIFGIFRLKP